MIEVETLIDLYDEVEVDVEGETMLESKLIAEDVVVKKMVRLEGLLPSQLCKRDGTIYKDRTKVYDETTREYFIIKGSYEDIKKLVLEEGRKIGF